MTESQKIFNLITRVDENSRKFGKEHQFSVVRDLAQDYDLIYHESNTAIPVEPIFILEFVSLSLFV